VTWDRRSRRRAELPKDWHARRARTKRLAGGRCQHVDAGGQRCTWTSPPRGSGQPDGHADHINRALGDEQSNLQWLCPAHHNEKSASEGHEAMRAIRALASHPRERHPGLA
jgi:5-methylcytosine-specific restriction protein A